jgi:hypothetical protein
MWHPRGHILIARRPGRSSSPEKEGLTAECR